MNAEGYDFIGDIHGQADELTALLGQLGYRTERGAYRHPGRTAVFLGDFIDRGQKNKEVLHIVRSMMEAGSAQAVLGNHEYNALCYHTPHPEIDGEYLRPHKNKNVEQHQEFLAEFPLGGEETREVLNWMRQLPLYLEFENARAIHACWHKEILSEISPLLRDGCLSPDFLMQSTVKGSFAHKAIEALLKGPEEPLPDGIRFTDKDGHERNDIRIKWWLSSPGTYRGMAMLENSIRETLPDEEFPAEQLIGYSPADVPVFFGHYWLEGDARVFADNIACVDYSVGNPGGKLACYRMNGEGKLDSKNFVAVSRL